MQLGEGLEAPDARGREPEPHDPLVLGVADPRHQAGVDGAVHQPDGTVVAQQEVVRRLAHRGAAAVFVAADGQQQLVLRRRQPRRLGLLVAPAQEAAESRPQRQQVLVVGIPQSIVPRCHRDAMNWWMVDRRGLAGIDHASPSVVVKRQAGASWPTKSRSPNAAPTVAGNGSGPDVRTGVRRVDHDASPPIDPDEEADVVDAARARSRRRRGRPVRAAGPGGSSGVASYWSCATRGSATPGHRVGGLHQARAVEADARGLAAPDVRGADLRQGPRHRHGASTVVGRVPAAVSAVARRRTGPAPAPGPRRSPSGCRRRPRRSGRPRPRRRWRTGGGLRRRRRRWGRRGSAGSTPPGGTGSS